MRRVNIKNEHKTLIDEFFSLSPYEFTLVGNIFAYFLASILTNPQQNSLGNLLELIAQVLLTIQAQSSLDDISIATEDINNLINILRNNNPNINHVIEVLNKIKNN